MRSYRLIALIALVLAIVATLLLLPFLDATAIKYTEAGLQRALATFGTARILDATISLLQSITVSVQAGVGTSIHPGAVLAPLDDLLEQFSALMLVATISFAAQRVLIELMGSTIVSVTIVVLVLAWGLSRFTIHVRALWLQRITIALICLRFAVPTVAVGSELIYQILMAKTYTESQMHIKVTTEKSTASNPGVGLFGKLKNLFSGSVNVLSELETVAEKVNGAVEHIAKLAALFAIQTIFLPIFFLWLMQRLYFALTSNLSAEAKIGSNSPGTAIVKHET